MSQHEQWDIASGVGITALGVAAARAIESSRPDRLIADPLAAAFVDAVPGVVRSSLRWPEDGAAVSQQDALLLHTSTDVGLRARVFDDYLLAACRDGIGQVVVLAAGLDSRAFRLAWPPGLRLFEIDQPRVLEFKDAVLRDQDAQPRCTRLVVPVDLRGDWPVALRDAGFAADLPTAWLAEGLLHYLDAAAEQALVSHIDDLSAPGSQIGVERADVAGLMDRGGLRRVGESSTVDMDQLFRTEPRPDPATWLAGRDWTVTVEPATAVAGRYHRDLVDPRLPGPPLRIAEHTAFLSAHRTGPT
ncbi:MAG: hypothetical protein V7603_6314 [Micromonosporaceae bacterium]